MAKPNSNDPIVPMDLANMRQNGVRSLAVQCRGCRHEVIMNVEQKMVCTKCGTIGADVRPNWLEKAKQ